MNRTKIILYHGVSALIQRFPTWACKLTYRVLMGFEDALGAVPSEEIVCGSSLPSSVPFQADSLSDDNLMLLGRVKAWEALRSGVQRLLLVYPAKVCEHCSEVHIGPSGHKARLCGVFKFESWRGSHFWKKAEVDHLVPPKIVWYRRPQDPPLLLDDGQNYYGHAPAVVDLCAKAGVIAPSKYFCMMKLEVEDDSTVLHLKIRIQVQENLPGDRLILHLNRDGDHLLLDDDKKRVSEYGVQDGSRLYADFEAPSEAENDGNDGDESENDGNNNDDDSDGGDAGEIEEENGGNNNGDDNDDDAGEIEEENDGNNNDDDSDGGDVSENEEENDGNNDDDDSDGGDASENEEENDGNNDDDDSDSSFPRTPSEETTVESPEFVDVSD
ncbi:hypothetical protein K7X08_014535 [Anisodus acutangulus]|uniref:Ubiquitin-like domain-containing protein n=1 Tax=Anisodus acutangulus TaxID=402998 RepID=A0A9Q1LM12_9SOLA|nr:hypothetical protein K7X08_014535 [Anisodus acutangulus]